MNLPNKLTLLRVVLVPAFVALLYIDFPFHYFAALFVFSAASITDAIDGHLARRDNLVTDFGKFLDPLADKILVATALICFIELDFLGPVSGIAIAIIIAREFMVSGLRLVTAGKGVVVAAGIWGKLKTAVTMSAIVYILAANFLIDEFDIGNTLTDILNICSIVLLWISVMLTVISGLVYIKGYWKYIDSGK